MTSLHSTDDIRSTDVIRDRQGPEAPRLPAPRLVGRSPRAPTASTPQASGPTRHLSRIPRYPPRHRRLDLGAIVVPVSRAGVGSGLAPAARLAEAKGSHLVVLRSGDAVGRPFPEALVPHSVRRTVVLDLPAGSASILPGWQSDEHPVATLHREGDLGFKRNVALLLGRMCGWDTLLFLGEDVRASPASDLTRVDDVLADFATYPQLHAAGWFQRDVDGAQATFVSGEALMVRCRGPLPLFPTAHNDAWLFVLHLLLGGWHTCPSSAVKYVGTIYGGPQPQAGSEELGDLLTEGLFSLLSLPREELFVSASSRSFWDEVIDERRRMITEQLFDLYRQGPLSGAKADAEAALRAAFNLYNAEGEPPSESLATFWSGLLEDQSTWSTLLASVTPAPTSDALTLDEGINLLGLSGSASWYRAIRRSPDTPVAST